jgi:ESF2/ABP1 family protein
MACDYLQARTIGGKKGSRYRDDVWNLLYLKGLKWRDITEQIAAENAERASRMRAEISKATKENKEFVRNVEIAKKLEGMQSKAAARRKRVLDEDGGENDRDVEMPVQERKRTFKQIPLAKKREPGSQPEWVNKVLGKIF